MTKPEIERPREIQGAGEFGGINTAKGDLCIRIRDSCRLEENGEHFLRDQTLAVEVVHYRRDCSQWFGGDSTLSQIRGSEARRCEVPMLPQSMNLPTLACHQKF